MVSYKKLNTESKADFMYLKLCYSVTGKRKPQYSSLVSSQPIVILQTTASPVGATRIQYKEVVIWWKKVSSKHKLEKVSCYFCCLREYDISRAAEPLLFFCIYPSRYSLKCLNHLAQMISYSIQLIIVVKNKSKLWSTAWSREIRMNVSVSPMPTKSSIAAIEVGSALGLPICLKFRILVLAGWAWGWYLVRFLAQLLLVCICTCASVKLASSGTNTSVAMVTLSAWELRSPAGITD